MIKRNNCVIPLVLACVLMTAGSQPGYSESIDSANTAITSLYKSHQPRANIITSGQPTAEQLAELKQAGIKHIVNLRPANEMQWDEEQLATSLGMQYHSIPVQGSVGVTLENARALAQLLDRIGSENVLVHCASGNRVGALAALSAADHGSSVNAAIAEGKRWGLTGLESIVRDTINADTTLCCAEVTGDDHAGK